MKKLIKSALVFGCASMFLMSCESEAGLELCQKNRDCRVSYCDTLDNGVKECKEVAEAAYDVCKLGAEADNEANDHLPNKCVKWINKYSECVNDSFTCDKDTGVASSSKNCDALSAYVDDACSPNIKTEKKIISVEGTADLGDLFD